MAQIQISDVPRLKVGDRGATAGWHTPYFQVASLCSIPHGSYIDSSDSPVIVPMTNTAHLEPPTLRGTQLLADSSMLCKK